MSSNCDVVIIGAGPVGSTIAHDLAQNGLKVTLIEKKKQIGYPLQCAGILSKHIFQYNTLPDEVIINNVKGAFLHTKNHTLNVEKQEDVAYIIDRIAYDEYLFKRALKHNVKFINKKAIDFDIEKGITFLSDNTQIKSKIIIGCDGYNSKLSSHIGNIQNNFNASQFRVHIPEAEMKIFRNTHKIIFNYVDTYLIEDILPGFLWIIPLKDDQYRIGLFSNHTHKHQDEILTDFIKQNFEHEILEKYKGFIPVYNGKNKIVEKRAVLIGDAASQIKPTSGGGLLIAFDACHIASKHIVEAIKKDDMNKLYDYQKEFNKKYHKEFNYQFKVQKTLNLLSDDDLDYFFLKLKEHDCEKLISEYGDMDTQSPLVKEFIKRGLIFKIMPKFLFKKITKIFGFR